MSTLKRRRKDRIEPPRHVRIEVACCDGSGFLGKAEALAFSCRGERIDLELSGGSAPRFTDDGDAIRLFRRNCLYGMSISGYGNWCWMAYDIYLEDAAWLLHRAIRCGKFSCDAASGNNACRLSDALDEDADLGEVTLYLGLFGSPLT